VIPYADSNFFTRLYLRLPGTEEASALLLELKAGSVPALPCSFLHRVEVMNAFQLHVFAGRTLGQLRVTSEQAAIAHAAFQDDLREGSFIRNFNPIPERLEQMFAELSLRHTAKHGFRTYDLMHVASALLLGCDTFWSFDAKARTLAGLEGLALQ
jgi:predicted nucleic acid-binding protein